MTEQELHKLYDCFESCEEVFTDSRKPIKGGLFFALSGPNFNGNRFARDALRQGAGFAVIDDIGFQESECCILVDDALDALQKLANYHRSKFNGPVLAITGSNGKTTTRELISAVLLTKYNLISTIGNLNNHIGVPLTILSISGKTDFVVIEMGASHIGEIRQLCKIAEPTHGLITNIGKAHMEGFGSIEGVKRGKKELYDYLFETKGIAFINSLDSVLNDMAAMFEEVISYPHAGDFCQDIFVSAQPYVEFKRESGNLVNTHLIGEYNFMNAATASCIGKYFDVPTSSIEEAISTYIPEINRSQVIEKGGNTIILDAYNANPNSMDAALKMLNSLEGNHKVIILGDMLELGDDEVNEHTLLGRKVSTMKPSLSLFCGRLIKHSADENPGSVYFDSKRKLVEFLQNNPITNSKILIKASRGIGLETIVDEI